MHLRKGDETFFFLKSRCMGFQSLCVSCVCFQMHCTTSPFKISGHLDSPPPPPDPLPELMGLSLRCSVDNWGLAWGLQSPPPPCGWQQNLCFVDNSRAIEKCIYVALWPLVPEELCVMSMSAAWGFTLITWSSPAGVTPNYPTHIQVHALMYWPPCPSHGIQVTGLGQEDDRVWHACPVIGRFG